MDQVRQNAAEQVRAFVETTLRTGLVLTDLLGNLIDALSEDSFPGENPAEVLVEMLAGSIRPVVDAAGTDAVQTATALMEAIVDKALEDLRAAIEVAENR